MTHYFNEYGDYEVDMLNKNAGTWTGGSKVLGTGKVSRRAALVAGILCLIVAFAAGATTVLRYTVSILRMDPYTIVHDPMRVLRVLPWDFIGLGLSVFVVAIAYSIEPFKLSSHALGELCVSYVLTLVTPVVGLLGQGGRISLDILTVLIPLFIINANRMVVMNIPDRAGDEEGGKVTSVVLLGEERSVTLHNVITLATYLSVIPALPLPLHIKIAYYSVLPLRWWQSLRLNVPKWWTQRYYTDSIPFVESMYVLSTGVALCVGLFFRVSFV
jgi:1,4-dihydroxy-2-naphthoate octaprenyltransferase